MDSNATGGRREHGEGRSDVLAEGAEFILARRARPPSEGDALRRVAGLEWARNELAAIGDLGCHCMRGTSVTPSPFSAAPVHSAIQERTRTGRSRLAWPDPDYAKDFRLNLSSVLDNAVPIGAAALGHARRGGACLAQCRGHRCRDCEGRATGRAKALEAAKAAASVMAMNNIIYYRAAPGRPLAGGDPAGGAHRVGDIHAIAAILGGEAALAA
jgi:hypothetical protein